MRALPALYGSYAHGRGKNSKLVQAMFHAIPFSLFHCTSAISGRTMEQAEWQLSGGGWIRRLFHRVTAATELQNPRLHNQAVAGE